MASGTRVLRCALLSLGVAGVPLGAAPLIAQETGTITGTVTDEATGRDLASVDVHVPGTGALALTQADGTYTLTGVPAGEIEVYAELLGYARGEATVDVPGGETVTVDFQLSAQAIGLGEVVATGTAGETERRAMGNVVGIVDASQIMERTHITSVDELLQNRVPGMHVSPPTGTHGIGQAMQLRGVTSLSLPSDPVIYIDGVRVDGAHDRDGVWLGGQHTSRLQDLSPQDIERIEIVKGAAAATLYGTQGSNGVIQIFTKRGSAGETEWQLEVGGGFERMPTDTFPGRLFTQFEGPDGFQAQDPIQEVGRGYHQRYNLSVSSGGEHLRYYVGTGFQRGEASIRPETNWERHYTARANLDALVTDDLTVSANMSVVSARARIPRGENAWESIYQSFAAGIPYTATEERPYGEPSGNIDAHATMEHKQGTRRATTGLTFDHAPFQRFRHRMTVGMDWYTEETTTLFPFGYEGAFYPRGNKLNHTRQFRDITSDYRATFDHEFSPSVNLRVTAGAQGNFTDITRVEAFGDQFPGPGLESVGAAAITSGTEFMVEEVNAGVFVDQTLELGDRLFLGAGLRLDGNSAFGDEFRYQPYPKGSVAYTVSEEDFWPTAFVSTMKLRMAYGAAGQAPAQFAADRTYQPISAKRGEPAVTPGNIGDPDLGPERSHEFEAGFDAGLWNDRVGLEFTAWRHRTRDALMDLNFPPSEGFLQPQFVNLGEVRNRGVEVQAEAFLLRRAGLEWSANAHAAHQRSELTDMGGLPPRNVQATRLAEGYPVNGIWSYEVDWDPETRTHTASDTMAYVGPADPVWSGGFGSELRWNRLTLSANAGFAWGHHRVNFQNWWDTYTGTGDKYLSLVEPPHGDPTPAADSLWDYTVTGGSNVFNYRADFLRVRELGVGVELPERWVQGVGAHRPSIRLSARNLWTWTRWPGMDPEVGYFGTSHVGRGMDWNSTPMPRVFMLSFRTSF